MYSKTQIEKYSLEATIEEIEAKLIDLEIKSIYGLTFSEAKKQRELEQKLNKVRMALKRLEAKGV